jgi:DNA-binding transcriptional ArsR family regulator
VLRVHFTAEDLARVRVSASWGPLAETLFSLEVLRQRRPNLLINGWRRAVLDHSEARAAQLPPLLPLTHLDLHTLLGETPSMDDALERLLAVHHEQLKSELDALQPILAKAPRSTRSWIRDLSRTGLVARRQLVACLRAYHRSAIDPYWDGVRSHLEVDRAVRGRLMTEGGVEGLLATLHPSLRWRPPVLEIMRPALPGHNHWPNRDYDVQLAGRSLVLVPSVFRVEHPALFVSEADVTLPALLVYPALREINDALEIWAQDPSGRVALEALLGRTRATALGATAEPCTTGELARRIGVSASTASHHASVLRDAGLISTRRTGSAVLHSITPRGAMLLDGHRQPRSWGGLRSA